MTTITLRPEHGYVLMAAGALAFESLALGGAVGGARSRVFGEEFKKRPAVKELEEQHKKAFPDQKFCVEGYPDMGSGMYAQQLTYEEWYKFNCAQRGHQNALETLPAALASLFAAGAVFPVTASVLAGAFGVGRLLYARGYRRRGPNGRVIGVVIADIGAAAAHATLRPLLTAALALILHDDRAGLLGLIGCAIRAGGKVSGKF